MMANRLPQTALARPVIMPLVYWDSNLKIMAMPVMIKTPARISSFEIRVLLMSGSKMAVNKVMDERHTSVTATVDNLMDAKNKIQCAPTRAPFNTNFKRSVFVTWNFD